MPPRTPNLNIKPIIKMPDQKLPVTPRPKNGGNTRITDYFTSIERTDNGKKSKRELEDEEDDQPTKRLKRSDDGHAGSIQTARYQIKVDTPKTRKPASARLLDDTDGGLRESLVGRWDFLEEETVEDEVGPQNTDIERDATTVDADDIARRRRSKAPSPRLPTPRPKKKSSSARILDDTDGGLNDALAGRFETTRYEEPITGDEAENPNHSPKHDGLSDSPKTTDNNDVTPRDRFKTPSLPPLPTTPNQHRNQSHEEQDPIPSNDPSPVPIRTPTHANNPRCRKPASSRLLDDVDGGLSDSLGGRFETPRYQEVEDLTHDTVDDDTEAEIIRMDDSEDDMSSAENCDNEDSEDENKENVPPRVRYRTPSPQRLPPVPEQHHDQNNETRNSTPNGPPSASPFSFLLPSPVVDLPAP